MEDLGNNQGFLRALALVLRLKPGGLLFAGLPCNSFAFMSKGSHRRSPTSPMGANYGFVVVGNMIAARSCILFLVALVRSTCWALENPARSTLPLFPYLEKMMGLPLFRHSSVVWWCPHLFLGKLALSSLAILGKAKSRQALYEVSLELEHLATVLLRWMGCYGHTSEKPELGLGNVFPGHAGHVYISRCSRLQI